MDQTYTVVVTITMTEWQREAYRKEWHNNIAQDVDRIPRDVLDAIGDVPWMDGYATVSARLQS